MKNQKSNLRFNLGHMQDWYTWPGDWESFPPENIEGFEVNKVNTEVWRKIPHSTKYMILNIKLYKTWSLKATPSSTLLVSLYKIKMAHPK